MYYVMIHMLRFLEYKLDDEILLSMLFSYIVFFAIKLT